MTTVSFTVQAENYQAAIDEASEVVLSLIPGLDCDAEVSVLHGVPSRYVGQEITMWTWVCEGKIA